MCVNLPNKWVNFILYCKLCKEKFTHIETFLHDRRSRWSRQISSLGGVGGNVLYIYVDQGFYICRSTFVQLYKYNCTEAQV